MLGVGPAFVPTGQRVPVFKGGAVWLIRCCASLWHAKTRAGAGWAGGGARGVTVLGTVRCCGHDAGSRAAGGIVNTGVSVHLSGSYLGLKTASLLGMGRLACIERRNKAAVLLTTVTA